MVVAEYCNGGYYKIGDEMVAEDKCWMGRLAQEGNVNAICCLREGYTSVLKPWAKPLFESNEAEAELNALKDVIRSVDGLTDDDIEQLIEFNCLNDCELMGDLYEKYDNPRLGERLGDCYYWGAEEQGVFRDRKKAKYYYERVGMDYEEDCDEDLVEVKYYVEGEGVKALKKLLSLMSEKIGVIDSKNRLFVPLRLLMMTLVGAAEYDGVVLTMEVGSVTAPMCAIRSAFANVNVRAEVVNG